jgi:hypothetical protein
VGHHTIKAAAFQEESADLLQVSVAVIAPGKRALAGRKLADKRVLRGERMGAGMALRRFTATHMAARHADARWRRSAAFGAVRIGDVQRRFSGRHKVRAFCRFLYRHRFSPV